MFCRNRQDLRLWQQKRGRSRLRQRQQPRRPRSSARRPPDSSNSSRPAQKLNRQQHPSQIRRPPHVAALAEPSIPQQPLTSASAFATAPTAVQLSLQTMHKAEQSVCCPSTPPLPHINPQLMDSQSTPLQSLPQAPGVPTVEGSQTLPTSQSGISHDVSQHGTSERIVGHSITSNCRT